MENQEYKPIEPGKSLVDPRRRSNGQFGAGNNANPDGSYKAKGFARWDVRVEQLTEKYPTCEDLMQFFTLTALGQLIPKGPLLEMNHIDAGIIRHLIENVIGREWLKANRQFWDRKDGTATQTVHLHKHNPMDDLPSAFDDTPEGQRAAAEALERVREGK